MGKTSDCHAEGIGMHTLLSDVLNLVPGQAASLYTPDVPLGSPQGIWRSQGVSAEALSEYMSHYKDVDVWARAASRSAPPPSGTVLDTDRLVERDRLQRSEFYNDYLRRHDVSRCLVAIVDDGRTAALPRIRMTVMRANEEPCFAADELRRFHHVARLVRSLVSVAAAEERTSRTAMLQQTTFDLVRMPVILADKDRGILLANRSAMNMMQAADGPLVRRIGRLRARHGLADRALGTALGAVAVEPGEVRFVRLGPGRPTRGAPAAMVSSVADPTARDGPRVLMIRVLGTHNRADSGEAVLRDVLGLTPPECAVALGLAEGLSHEEIARRRGVKVTTVRTTLKRLQDKLGIQKSGPLARFVTELTALGGLGV